MKKVVIEGMSCNHCVGHVKNGLMEVEGVTSVEVDLASKTATIEGEISDEKIKEVIDEVGYEVVSIN
ncbi:heavy-metal-associated domain-containing protein [Clostridium hydrogeniformans]|uniref:heavy-metal-associated domain-containing protein n=1 Tax=Clostridium hydrogeniformans TaxID=349933 RepID=UPI0004831E7C|nr:cation transporter [Clostridium hydrogeniformans]